VGGVVGVSNTLPRRGPLRCYPKFLRGHLWRVQSVNKGVTECIDNTLHATVFRS
jgi:hypothetical protein